MEIETDWLQTGFWLASDSKIGVNGTMLYPCNPTAFYQSEASWKPVGCKFNFDVNEQLGEMFWPVENSSHRRSQEDVVDGTLDSWTFYWTADGIDEILQLNSYNDKNT